MPRPAILCDIGNVLVSFDFRVAARRFAENSDCPEDQLLDRLHHLKLPFEDGEIDDATFVREAISAIGFHGPSAEFIRIWCDIFTPNPPINATLERLSRSLPLYLLSNTSGLHKDFLFTRFPVFGLFQDGVYSYSARASKPGRRIFDVAVSQFSLDPALTFFIDDLLPNIDTAAELGFVTHHYHASRHSQFESALASWQSSLT